MTDLSPAALAVRDAAERQTDLDFRYAPMIAAAALEAAADQVAPDEPHPELSQFWDDEADREWQSNQQIRRQLLAIAAELRGQEGSNDDLSPQAQPEPEFTAEEVEMIQAPWSYLSPPQPLEKKTEQAFAALEAVQRHTTDPKIIEPLRLALVRLRELEAQPEPELPRRRPTDEELLSMRSWSGHTFESDLVDFARAVLARWGQSQQNKETTND
jgi:hypothetical protein